MSEQINHMPLGGSVALLDGPYRDVIALLETARDYAGRPRPAPVADGFRSATVVSIRHLEASCEALRVTSRLSHCLAWLMIQKAIHAGELPPEAAWEPENRLPAPPVCTAIGGERNPSLPSGLRDLLRMSRQLYERLARLDAQLDAVSSGCGD